MPAPYSPYSAQDQLNDLVFGGSELQPPPQPAPAGPPPQPAYSVTDAGSYAGQGAGQPAPAPPPPPPSPPPQPAYAATDAGTYSGAGAGQPAPSATVPSEVYGGAAEPTTVKQTLGADGKYVIEHTFPSTGQGRYYEHFWNSADSGRDRQVGLDPNAMPATDIRQLPASRQDMTDWSVTQGYDITDPSIGRLTGGPLRPEVGGPGIGRLAQVSAPPPTSPSRALHAYETYPDYQEDFAPAVGPTGYLSDRQRRLTGHTAAPTTTAVPLSEPPATSPYNVDAAEPYGISPHGITARGDAKTLRSQDAYGPPPLATMDLPATGPGGIDLDQFYQGRTPIPVGEYDPSTRRRELEAVFGRHDEPSAPSTPPSNDAAISVGILEGDPSALDTYQDHPSRHTDHIVWNTNLPGIPKAGTPAGTQPLTPTPPAPPSATLSTAWVAEQQRTLPGTWYLSPDGQIIAQSATADAGPRFAPSTTLRILSEQEDGAPMYFDARASKHAVDAAVGRGEAVGFLTNAEYDRIIAAGALPYADSPANVEAWRQVLVSPDLQHPRLVLMPGDWLPLLDGAVDPVTFTPIAGTDPTAVTPVATDTNAGAPWIDDGSGWHGGGWRDDGSNRGRYGRASGGGDGGDWYPDGGEWLSDGDPFAFLGPDFMAGMRGHERPVDNPMFAHLFTGRGRMGRRRRRGRAGHLRPDAMSAGMPWREQTIPGGSPSAQEAFARALALREAQRGR